MSRNVFERRKFHEKSGYQSTVYPQCPEASPADPDGRKERRQNYHYDSPSALLADIEHQFLEENLAIFRSYWKTQRDRNLMTELFLCIRKSGDFCRILMGPTGDSQILRRLQDIIRDGVLDEWQKEFPAYVLSSDKEVIVSCRAA